MDLTLAGITAERLFAFIVTCAVIEITPGPNMAYLAVLSATKGRKSGYAAVAGVALGLLIVGLAAALGLAAAISASPLLFEGLRWAGVGYLLWLAWDAWRVEAAEENEFAASDARYFRRGLMVNLLNPKAGVFYVAMLPQFVSPDAPLVAQTVTLSLIFVAVATGIHASIVTLAGFSQRYLSDQNRRQIVRRLMAVTLVLIALWFAWSTRI
jgi:threonine/homoserine/homoserine lactone efflux protein